MEKEDNYTTSSAMASGFADMDYNSVSIDRAPFAGFGDVMQFSDFGPRLALQHQSQAHEAMGGMTRFDDTMRATQGTLLGESSQGMMKEGQYYDHGESNDGNEAVVQLEFLGASNQKPNNGKGNNNSKRKRARAVKTTEEVESQRMTHIAVERNRRKQMNEHLRVLRTLMPSSYVQRGDQASIIGGAIEFVRELEELLQCLESQKRRRLYGEGGAPPGGGGGVVPIPSNQPFDPSNGSEDQDPNKLVDLDNTMIMAPLPLGSALQEETAESKSTIADVEVKLTGFDAFIKILSRRRPGQLIKAIAALQDLQFNILHTNITSIEQTVLYSFNVQISSDTRFSAEDIASSVQQIFTFIHASAAM